MTKNHQTPIAQVVQRSLRLQFKNQWLYRIIFHKFPVNKWIFTFMKNHQYTYGKRVNRFNLKWIKNISIDQKLPIRKWETEEILLSCINNFSRSHKWDLILSTNQLLDSSIMYIRQPCKKPDLEKVSSTKMILKSEISSCTNITNKRS